MCTGYPFETCGVLIGEYRENTTFVQKIIGCNNLNTERASDRFLLDPDDFLNAELNAKSDQLDIVGIWHSHPDHPAIPSPTDLEAAWPNWSYLISSVSSNGIEKTRSWRLNGNHFEEEEIQS